MVPGGVAEWLGTGLQNLLHRFNSGPRLSSGRAPATAYNLSERALSSGGERFLDAEEVRGSNPLAPTSNESTSATMKLTTVTNISVDGVMQGLGGADEDRRGGFGRGGGRLVRSLFDNQLVDEIILPTEPVVGGQGARLFPDAGPDAALDPVDYRATSGGLTVQVYRPAGRPRYATGTAD